MRVIAGKYRGTTLAEFEGRDIRPTTDRTKEALFSMLMPYIAGSRVLDLFCGSGSLGIEALSRGAEEAVFNDFSKESLSVLKKNLTKLRICAKIFNNDFKTCLSNLTDKFDIILLDPPYALECINEILEMIKKRNLLADDGIIVYERDRSYNGKVEGFEVIKEKKYSISYVTLIKKV